MSHRLPSGPQVLPELSPQECVRPARGVVGGSDPKFAVGSGRGRKPDLTVYFPGSRRPPARGLIRVPPDIAIEIVSATPPAGRRGRGGKTGDYAAFGGAWAG